MRQSDLNLKIIAYLINKSDWTTTKELSDEFDMSIRSIKNYVSDISKQYENLIISSNKGYKINKEQAREIVSNSTNDGVPDGYQARKSYIIKTILLEKQQVTLGELADYLCISPITLQNEIAKMRNDLSPYRLNIRTKNDNIYITGLDSDKQKVIMNLIDEEIQSSYYSIDYIQSVFENIDVKLVQKIVIGVLNKYEYFLDNYSLLNYVLHLCLTIEIKGNNKEEPSQIEENHLHEIASPHIQMMVEDIYKELKEVYDTNYSLSNIYEASVLMMTRVVSNDTNNLHYKEVSAVLGERVVSLLDKIKQSVQDTYCITLDNESFLIRFAFHLKNLLLRIENDVDLGNIQFPNIKNEYPLIYAISAHIANIVSQECNHPLSQDEISYIALHIGMLMEEDKAKKERIPTIIVCTDYIGMGKKLFSKLSGVFNENLLISNIVTDIDDQEDLNNIELIISTEKIKPDINVPVVYIEPFISESNIRSIFSTIDEIKNTRKENVIREKLLYFFHDDIFFVNEKFNNEKDAIEKICDVMIKKRYVDKNFKDEIYKKENVSSSSYGNVAIAHPLDNEAKSSAIAVSINPKSVRWGENDVNLIFIFSLTEDDRELFSDIFDLVTHIINNPSLFKKILAVNTFDEFVDELVSNY